MAEAGITQVFQDLSNQLKIFATNVGTHGVSNVVKNFDGDKTQFKPWLKSIEKFALIKQLDDESKKMICYETSLGPVSDFIHRYLKENVGCTWANLKATLNSRFSEIKDTQHAFYLLRNIKQKQGENVHLYLERLLELAEDAYDGQNYNDLAIVEKQLIGIFTDGLAEDYLKIKVMRDNPQTLQAALISATGEQNLRVRFQLRNRFSDTSQNSSTFNEHEPMEIDHIRPQKPCTYCHKLGHQIKDCRKWQHQIHAVSQIMQHTFRQQHTQHPCNHMQSYRQTSKFSRQTECWKCGKLSHIQRYCTYSNRHLN